MKAKLQWQRPRHLSCSLDLPCCTPMYCLEHQHHQQTNTQTNNLLNRATKKQNFKNKLTKPKHPDQTTNINKTRLRSSRWLWLCGWKVTPSPGMKALNVVWQLTCPRYRLPCTSSPPCLHHLNWTQTKRLTKQNETNMTHPIQSMIKHTQTQTQRKPKTNPKHSSMPGQGAVLMSSPQSSLQEPRDQTQGDEEDCEVLPWVWFQKFNSPHIIKLKRQIEQT